MLTYAKVSSCRENLQGITLCTPTPPNTLLGVGLYTRRGAYNNRAAGGFKRFNRCTPSLPVNKRLLAKKGGRKAGGWRVYIYIYIFFFLGKSSSANSSETSIARDCRNHPGHDKTTTVPSSGALMTGCARSGLPGWRAVQAQEMTPKVCTTWIRRREEPKDADESGQNKKTRQDVVCARHAEVLPWNFLLKHRMEVAMQTGMKCLAKFCCASFLRETKLESAQTVSHQMSRHFSLDALQLQMPNSWRFSLCRRLSLKDGERRRVQQKNRNVRLSLTKITLSWSSGVLLAERDYC